MRLHRLPRSGGNLAPHGVATTLGFAVPALLAWRRLGGRPAPDLEARP